MRTTTFLWIAFTLPLFVNAQKEDSIYYKLTLDEFVVKDIRLDLKNFIKKVQTDETFYRAFKRLRKNSYTASNQITMFDAKKNIRTSYKSQTIQHFEGDCRTMEVKDEQIIGQFF